MAETTGRTPALKSTETQRASWEWSTVPMAHSPQGFAELPYPWQKAKDQALKAHQATKATRPEAALPPTSAQQADTLADLARLLDPKAQPRQAALLHMLFHALRDRPLQLLDLSEGGADPAALRLWLEYFPQGQIHALSKGKRPRLKDPRLTAHRADPADAAAMHARFGAKPHFDIILDAARPPGQAHPAFLTLFPALMPAGFYILDGQPDGAADPFRAFAATGRFSHSDRKLQAGLAAFEAEIAGCHLVQAGLGGTQNDQIIIVQKR